MKILHITFHQGCCNAIESVLYMLNIELETRIVTSSIDGYFYNMTSQRALNAWNLHKDFYNQFDVIITSDTAPLSRIFIEGGFKGKVVTWISNRFDYSDSKDKCGFPDEDYYDLLRNRGINTFLVANCQFESFYASKKWIAVDDVINPAQQPYYIKDKVGFYVPTYSNDTLLSLFNICRKNGFSDVATGRYKDRDSLAHFKAVVHLPYTWNSIALWDALSCGVAYYVPSKEFLLKLLKTQGYWFQNMNYCWDHLDLCEFYKHKFVKYFDSFEELREIEINNEEIYEESERLFKLNQQKWINILNT